MGKLDEKCALITGGAKGIGRAIALAFAAEGAHVAVNDFTEMERARATAGEIEALGRKSLTVEADVSDEKQVEEMAARVTRELGRIDILVTNAGIGGAALGPRLPVWELPTERWERMLAVNLSSQFLCIKHVAPQMIERGWGRIITISSQLALKPAPQVANYVTAKAGVVALTKSVAQELAPYGVLVNSVAPGPTDTDMWNMGTSEFRDWKLKQVPLGRPGRPEEIAPAVVMLASEEGSYFVGQVVSPNGGDVI